MDTLEPFGSTTNISIKDCKIDRLIIKNFGRYEISNSQINEIEVNEVNSLIISVGTIKDITFYSGWQYSNIILTGIFIDRIIFNCSKKFKDLNAVGLFCKELQFLDVKLESTCKVFRFDGLKLRNVMITKDSDLSQIEFSFTDFSHSCLEVYNTSFEGLKFSNVKWFKKIYSHTGSKNPPEDYDICRDFKNKMVAIKNKPSELHFKKLEYDARLKNLSWRNDFQDKFILFLNKFTNYHGTSWLLSAFWIFFLGIVFFTGFIHQSSLQIPILEGVRCHFAKYLLFLLPTHSLDILGENTLTDASIIWDFVYRLLSFFLIYQFIAAFRKYKE